jgi:hypothetical protein
MKTLFLAWQNPLDRTWFPIGRLIFDGISYQFFYIQGILAAHQQCGLRSLPSFPELDLVYRSPELFPLFANRLLRRSRPDYADFLRWLNIPSDRDDPMAMLAKSGGQRATDTLFVFPCPEPDENGFYHFHFFARELLNLPPLTASRISRLQTGELLRLVGDSQNPHDRRALMLSTEDDYLVGYCPPYLLDIGFDLSRQSLSLIDVVVERINMPPAPLQFRLLCHLKVRMPQDLRPFLGAMYQPLSALNAAA